MDIVESYVNIYGYGEIYIEDTIQRIYRPQMQEYLYMRKFNNIEYLDVGDVYKFVTGLLLSNVSGLYHMVNEKVPVNDIDNTTIPAYNYSHYKELAKVCMSFDEQFSGR